MKLKLFGYAVTIVKELDRKKAASGGVWVTADGSPIRISDMDDEHLMNCIRMKERYAVARIQYRKTEFAIRNIGHEIFFNDRESKALVDEARSRVRQKRIAPFTVVGMEIK